MVGTFPTAPETSNSSIWHNLLYPGHWQYRNSLYSRSDPALIWLSIRILLLNRKQEERDWQEGRENSNYLACSRDRVRKEHTRETFQALNNRITQKPVHAYLRRINRHSLFVFLTERHTSLSSLVPSGLLYLFSTSSSPPFSPPSKPLSSTTSSLSLDPWFYIPLACA